MTNDGSTGPTWRGDDPSASSWAAPQPASNRGDRGQAPPPATPVSSQPAAPVTYRSWQPGIIPLRPLNFGDVLVAPFKAMRFNRAVVLGLPLVISMGAALIGAAAIWALYTDPQLGLLSAVPSFSGVSPLTIALGIGAVAIYFLADVIAGAVVAPGIARGALGEKITASFALSQVWRRFWSLVGLYLLQLLVLFTVWGIVGGGAVAVIVALVAIDDGMWALAILIVLAVGLVFILASAIVTLFTTLLRPIIVLEDVGVFQAIRRLRALLRGGFWRALGEFVVGFIAITVVSQAIGSVFQFALVLPLAFLDANPDIAAIAFAGLYALVVAITGALTYSYIGGLSATIYIDLRIRQEGFDIDLARAAEARAGAR